MSDNWKKMLDNLDKYWCAFGNADDKSNVTYKVNVEWIYKAFRERIKRDLGLVPTESCENCLTGIYMDLNEDILLMSRETDTTKIKDVVHSFMYCPECGEKL